MGLPFGFECASLDVAEQAHNSLGCPIHSRSSQAVHPVTQILKSATQFLLAIGQCYNPT
jgi:hypothetical protein